VYVIHLIMEYHYCMPCGVPPGAGADGERVGICWYLVMRINIGFLWDSKSPQGESFTAGRLGRKNRIIVSAGHDFKRISYEVLFIHVGTYLRYTLILYNTLYYIGIYIIYLHYCS